MYGRRLTGLKLEDQSAHYEGCDGNCCRLFWDEESYLSVDGTRAVSITRTSAESGIQYCSASFRSLAISLVWSHVRGGGWKTESTNAYTEGTPKLQHDIIVIPIGGTQPAFLSLIIYAEKPSEASIRHLLQAKLSLSAIKML